MASVSSMRSKTMKRITSDFSPAEPGIRGAVRGLRTEGKNVNKSQQRVGKARPTGSVVGLWSFVALDINGDQ